MLKTELDMETHPSLSILLHFDVACTFEYLWRKCSVTERVAPAPCLAVSHW